MSDPANDRQFKRRNHFVPRSYLKQWAGDDGRLWVYRLLVPHERVPLWKPASPKAVTVHDHLYTKVVSGTESDEIERWLDAEFEGPAERVLDKVSREERLTADDWHRLVRFLAAQDVRTPARLMESIKRWQAQLPGMLEDVMREAVAKMEAAQKQGKRLEVEPREDSELLGGKLTTSIAAGAGMGTMRYEMIAGRNLWLFHIKHLLTRTAQHLHRHRWTILRAPPGMEWPTSDDPVIRLNFNNSENYDFGGGWGSKGTEIFMPLNPRHLMYTHIGERPPEKWSVVPDDLVDWFLRFIVEHAHRHVLARTPDHRLPVIRPRKVDREQHRHEEEQWRLWHEEQTAAETRLHPGR